MNRTGLLDDLKIIQTALDIRWRQRNPLFDSVRGILGNSQPRARQVFCVILSTLAEGVSVGQAGRKTLKATRVMRVRTLVPGLESLFGLQDSRPITLPEDCAGFTMHSDSLAGVRRQEYYVGMHFLWYSFS